MSISRQVVALIAAIILIAVGCVPAVESIPSPALSVTPSRSATGEPDSAPVPQMTSTLEEATSCDMSVSWEIAFEQSGGFAGTRQWITINSNGELIAYDEKAGKTNQAQAPQEELDQIASMLADACPFEEASRLPGSCADCYQYSLQIVIGNQRYGVQEDDTSLPDSEFALLINKLAILLQQALSDAPES